MAAGAARPRSAIGGAARLRRAGVGGRRRCRVDARRLARRRPASERPAVLITRLSRVSRSAWNQRRQPARWNHQARSTPAMFVRA